MTSIAVYIYNFGCSPSCCRQSRLLPRRCGLRRGFEGSFRGLPLHQRPLHRGYRPAVGASSNRNRRASSSNRFAQKPSLQYILTNFQREKVRLLGHTVAAEHVSTPIGTPTESPRREDHILTAGRIIRELRQNPYVAVSDFMWDPVAKGYASWRANQ